MITALQQSSVLIDRCTCIFYTRLLENQNWNLIDLALVQDRPPVAVVVSAGLSLL